MSEKTKERLLKQLDFILELDKEKQVGRQTYLSDGSRKENDAEHAWHMALMTMILWEYGPEDMDRFRVMSMVLIHDIVEIYAGDTYAYDEAAKETQKEREQAAAEKLFSMLPEDQEEEIRSLFDEFEKYETAESKFAHLLDNFQPVLLNNASNGKSWREHGVKISQILKRNKRTKEGSMVLWERQLELLEENIRKGNIIDDR